LIGHKHLANRLPLPQKKLTYEGAKIRIFHRHPTKKQTDVDKKTFCKTDVVDIDFFCIFAAAFLKRVP
jgi:hypothetical protein